MRFVVRDHDPQTARRLAATGLPVPLARALAARGIQRPEELQLRTPELLPPGALRHVDEAARLLADAIEARRALRIVADYDCDGATACAVGLRGLRLFGARVDYLVPNRFRYGYGLSPEIVDLAAAGTEGAPGRPDLLITVDNGIASVDGVARANALGLEVLITDHHLPGARLPEARCIVNPNQPGCGFPSKVLAGVGVMFYVLTALRAELRRRGRFDEATQPRLDPLLDLVALGTVADVVPLDRNNRILVAAGLQRMRAGRMQAGLAALLQVSGRHHASLRAADLGFVLGPRINAAGRLDDMTVGIECLGTDDPVRALELARRLDQLNRERREIEADMQFDALADLDPSRLEGRRTLTLYQPDWHQGVVGLVAARVKERCFRPTIAFAPGDAGELRGSGRSIEGVHLRDVLDLVSKAEPALIRRFGGHAAAAGLTIAAADLPRFTEVFEAVAAAATAPSLYRRVIDTDGALHAADLNLGLVGAIDDTIWGQGFPAPLFANEFRVLEQRLVGQQHLRLTLELEGRRFAGIWFRRADPLPERALLAYRPVADTYQGTPRLQLQVEHAGG